jgi:beta-lactamase regulating signal transducer with metallopeptidase domain
VNAFGLLISGGILHATGFAVIGSMAYLALRRWSPAAGVLATVASLIIMALVSMAALAPVPRSWTITIGQARLNEPQPQAMPRSEFDQANRPGGDLKMETARVAQGEQALPSPTPRNERSDASTWIDSFLGELRQPAVAPEQPGWGWPAWVVIGFSTSVALGLARLGLGVLSIQRLRARSLQLNDRDLIDAVDVLRAELSWSRKVEIRETSELATPATIGWRRPLLLLPADWRDWNDHERRAVLAHELAHICRNDFMTGLAGQISLTLHFYNPLAHWLAARLRLEQELAADAWGASLAGGKQSYLATLAQMALRRDSRALTWPARAFLPSRGTFVRRIEMLRNTSQIRHAPLPAVARLITIAVLCALGLLVAGVRGPAGPSNAQAQPPQPAARPAQTPANESYNLAFLPADARMVVAVRPRALLERPEMKPVLESFKRSTAFDFDGILPVLPEDVEQLLLFWAEVEPSERGRILMVPFPSGAVLRTSKPQDWNSLAKTLHLGATQEIRHDGQTYLRIPGMNEKDWGAFATDDRTMVFAREVLLRELIEDRKAPAQPHPWDAAWNKARKGQLMVAFETRWLRRQLAPGLRGGPLTPGADRTLETISPLLDKAQSYALGIDSSAGLTADLVAVARSDDDVKPIADTLQAVLTLAANAARANPREFYGLHTEAMDWITQTRDSLLNGSSIRTEGRFAHLQAKSSVDFAGVVKFLQPAVAAANSASLRKQSVINLKHIGLAFYNYHTEHGRFPAPVLYGGATGKVPYSWRVAILPYLENNPLYKQYNFDEPWDGPSNRKLLDKMPAFYSYPAPDGSPASRTNTAYFVFTGKGTALSPPAKTQAAGGMAGGALFPGGSAARKAGTPPQAGSGPPGPMMAEIIDGTSNTILAVEARRDIPWTKPEDIPFDSDEPLPELGGFSPNGFNAAFADGAVRFISNSADPTVLKALITRAGGEVISLDNLQTTIPRATTSPRR